MRTVYISLSSVKSVQEFVSRISPLKGQFDIISDGYVIDAKSIMSIFSLDITKPLKLQIEKDTKEAMQIIERYIVKETPENSGRQDVLEDT